MGGGLGYTENAGGTQRRGTGAICFAILRCERAGKPSTYTHVRLGLPVRSRLVWLATCPSASARTHPPAREVLCSRLRALAFENPRRQGEIWRRGSASSAWGQSDLSSAAC